MGYPFSQIMSAMKGSVGGTGAIVPPVAAALHFDGACRGNPGTAGTGFVLRDGNGRVIERFSRLLGYNLTNNVAEYKALIAGLRHALANGISDIVAYGDSELVCNQVNGQYRVRDRRLERYYNSNADFKHVGFCMCLGSRITKQIAWQTAES